PDVALPWISLSQHFTFKHPARTDIYTLSLHDALPISILTECTTDMSVVQEEGFGPVITVERFTTETEAIQLANDSVYGLSGGVWTQDIAKAERCVNEMRMGTVWINDVNNYF